MGKIISIKEYLACFKIIAIVLLLIILTINVIAEEKEYLGNAKSEKAAERALSFLASVQTEKGDFNTGDRKNLGNSPAIVGVAGLAFLAGGHLPLKGKYGSVTAKIVEYIKSLQAETGLIARNQAMYEHGFATLALCEFYGITKDKGLKETIQKAINLIISCQNAKGGWRYQPKIADDDSSVSSAQIQAIRAAKDVGIAIPKETIAKAIEYIKSCSTRSGGFSYTPNGGGTTVATAGSGALSLMALGDYTAPEIEKSCDWLMKYKWDTNYEHFYYAMYYCTQAMYQKGGNYWKSWYPSLRDYLVENQNADGSWNSGQYGSFYATAFAALILQLPNAYLPLFER